MMLDVTSRVPCDPEFSFHMPECPHIGQNATQRATQLIDVLQLFSASQTLNEDSFVCFATCQV